MAACRAGARQLRLPPSRRPPIFLIFLAKTAERLGVSIRTSSSHPCRITALPYSLPAALLATVLPAFPSASASAISTCAKCCHPQSLDGRQDDFGTCRAHPPASQDPAAVEPFVHLRLETAQGGAIIPVGNQAVLDAQTQCAGVPGIRIFSGRLSEDRIAKKKTGAQVGGIGEAPEADRIRRQAGRAGELQCGRYGRPAGSQQHPVNGSRQHGIQIRWQGSGAPRETAQGGARHSVAAGSSRQSILSHA